MKKGFTLIEVLVSISLFAIIMVIVSALFVQSLDLQRRAFNIQQAEENASYILEAMIKEIRVAQMDPSVADNDCSGAPAASLTIIHPDHGVITFALSGTDVIRTVAGVSTTLNSNTVQFKSLGFCILGTASGDGKQPRITIITDVMSAKTRQQAEIRTQTTISLRAISN